MGGSNPIQMSEYRGTQGLPTGQISASDFYDLSNGVSQTSQINTVGRGGSMVASSNRVALMTSSQLEIFAYNTSTNTLSSEAVYTTFDIITAVGGTFPQNNVYPEVGGDDGGTYVSMDATGTRVVIGFTYENSFGFFGAFAVFVRSGSTWSVEQASIAGGSNFGSDTGVMMSPDGTKMLLMATMRSSQQFNRSPPPSAATQIWTRSGSTWSRVSDSDNGGYVPRMAKTGYAPNNTTFIAPRSQSGLERRSWTTGSLSWSTAIYSNYKMEDQAGGDGRLNFIGKGDSTEFPVIYYDSTHGGFSFPSVNPNAFNLYVANISDGQPDYTLNSTISGTNFVWCALDDGLMVVGDKDDVDDNVVYRFFRKQNGDYRLIEVSTARDSNQSVSQEGAPCAVSDGVFYAHDPEFEVLRAFEVD